MDNVLQMQSGMYLRTVGPVSIAEKFPNIPGIYKIGGSLKTIVKCQAGVEEGTVSFLVMMDPAIAKAHQTRQEKYEKDLAEWPKRVKEWEEGPKQKGFFKVSTPREPIVPTEEDGPLITIMKLDDNKPALIYGEGHLIGIVGDLYFFTTPNQMGSAFDKVLGGLFR